MSREFFGSGGGVRFLIRVIQVDPSVATAPALRLVQSTRRKETKKGRTEEIDHCCFLFAYKQRSREIVCPSKSPVIEQNILRSLGWVFV